MKSEFTKLMEKGEVDDSYNMTGRKDAVSQLKKKDKPEAGKLYALTGAPGSKCIANGNTWAESVVGEEVKP